MQNTVGSVQRGWTVFGLDDEKIGDVADVGPNYVLVQKGLIFPKDIFIPTSVITEVHPEDQCLHINASKRDVETYDWDMAPDVSQTESSGYSTADTPGYATGETAAVGYDTTTAQTADSARLTVHEEELQAQTRRQQTGEVEVGKRVVAEEQELDVPVTHEEVEVRRVRVNRADAGTEPAFQDEGETIRVPVTAESIEVTKQPRVVEEIEITKRPVTETQRVRETVRREEVDIHEQGDVRVGQGDLVGAGSDRIERSPIDDQDTLLGDRDRETRSW